MIELWVFGNRVAFIFGIRIYLLVYLLGGGIAGFTTVWYQRNGIGFGASVATLCLLGVLISHYGSRFLQLSRAGRWKFAVLLAYGLVSTVPDAVHPSKGNVGHPVGLVLGLIFGMALDQLRADRCPFLRLWGHGIHLRWKRPHL
jgi:membrane associated rhomboid family serine protease